MYLTAAEGTGMVDYNDEERTERTEVLSDDEERIDGLEEVGLEKRRTSPVGCSRNHGKMDYVADTDASTDEEDDEGFLSRSFTELHAASSRSSDPAAACSITQKITDTERESSFSSSDFSKNKENAVAALSGAKAIGIDIGSNVTRNQTSLATIAGEMELDHEVENSHRCLQNYYSDKSMNRVNNSRVRKLFNEVTSAGKEEAMCKTDSYIGSQEPGELSQAIAMDVVDKLLWDNDVDLSQKIESGKPQGSNSPPILSVRGAQCLANWADHRSSVGKSGIFDWVDSLADEGRGDLLSKRNDSFSESRGGAWETHSQTLKPRHLRSGVHGNSVDMSGEKEGENLSYYKTTSLTCSDSRLILDGSTTEKLHITETRTMNLYNDSDEQLKLKSLEQRVEVTDVGVAQEMYDIGPSTQMAAEAMEALFHGSPVNCGLREDAHLVTGNLTEDFNIGMTMKKTSSKKVLLQKRAPSTHDSEGKIIRYKRRKVTSRVKNKLENREEKTKTKREKSEHEAHSRCSAKANEFTRSLKEEKACYTVDGTFVKEVDKCGISRAPIIQLSITKRLILGEVPFNAIPVAPRTRRSKSLKLSKSTKTSSSDDEKAMRVVTEVSNPGDKMGEDKLVADASRLLDSKRKGPNKGLKQVTKLDSAIGSYPEVLDIEDLHKGELKTSSMITGAFSHPKRRRTHRISLRKSKVNANLNNSSISVDVNLVNVMQHSTRRGGNEVIVKSLPEILDTVKQKRRSVSVSTYFQTDNPFDTRKMSSISDVRTRSSVNSHSFITYSEKDSKECKLALSEVGSMVATDNGSSLVNHGVSPKEVALLKQGADPVSNAQDIKENAKPEGSLKRNDQPCGLACSTPLKTINTVSPICKAQDPPRTAHNKSSPKSSIARELIRLEATEAASTWLLKDSRRRKYMARVRVMFSNHLDEDIIKQQKKILARFGVPIASSISDATHFVADKFARTRNMLEAMAMGKPVVTHMWLDSCGQTSCFIDEKNYLLRDLKKEKEIGFSMPVSLARACQCPLLQGRRVFITPNVKPGRELVASLVKATHGQLMERIWRSAMKDNTVPDDLLVISCEEDYAICTSLLDKGAEIFSSELLLNGIVIQKLEFERHRLFSNVKRTHSTIWLR